MRHLRCSHLLFVASLALSPIAVGCSGAPPDAAAAPGPVGSPSAQLLRAASRTAQADSGRYVVAIDIGTTGVPNERRLHTTVRGAYDHARGAVDASVDVAQMLDSAPFIAEGIPPEMLGDTIDVRVIGRRGWVRYRSDGPWREVPASEADVSSLEGIYGPDELLALLDHTTGEIEVAEALVPDETRYSGHIDPAAVAGDDGALGRTGSALPPELAETFLRFDAWVGDDGVVRRMLVELDVRGMAEAVGEEVPPDVIVFRFSAEWVDLGEPVQIEPPVDPVDPSSR